MRCLKTSAAHVFTLYSNSSELSNSTWITRVVEVVSVRVTSIISFLSSKISEDGCHTRGRPCFLILCFLSFSHRDPCQGADRRVAQMKIILSEYSSYLIYQHMKSKFWFFDASCQSIVILAARGKECNILAVLLEFSFIMFNKYSLKILGKDPYTQSQPHTCTLGPCDKFLF